MKDLLTKDPAELAKLKRDKRNELQTLRLQKVGGSNDSSQFGKLRKEVARISTVLSLKDKQSQAKASQAEPKT